MSETRKKRGRPKKDSARNVQLKTMLTREEMDRLSYNANMSGRSMSDINREALRLYLLALENGL